MSEHSYVAVRAEFEPATRELYKCQCEDNAEVCDILQCEHTSVTLGTAKYYAKNMKYFSVLLRNFLTVNFTKKFFDIMTWACAQLSFRYIYIYVIYLLASLDIRGGFSAFDSSTFFSSVAPSKV